MLLRAVGSRLLLLVTLLVVYACVAPGALAQEGWVIERLHVEFDVRPDTSIDVREDYNVDFRALLRHGLLRDIVIRQAYDPDFDRRYEISAPVVTSTDGRNHPVQVSDEGSLRRFRIGDPNREISGREDYRVAYTLRGALNGFPRHDEFYWNATGTWPVPIAQVSVLVRVPAGGIERVDCFQGARGSTEPCRSTFTADEAMFEATRSLEAGEQFTIVTGVRKGAVTAPSPLLVLRPRDITRFFDLTPAMLAVLIVGLVAAAGGVSALWWRVGRDRRYVSLRYLSQETAEERVPLFGSDPIVVEFTPPDGLRPGQMGLLLDERADTLDITATIVDLAVRGYLRIAEIPKTGWFGKMDWQLERANPPDNRLLTYERIVLDGLFSGGSPCTLSSLKNKFYRDLSRAKKALYSDAVARRWFHWDPNAVRLITRTSGFAVSAAGLGVTAWLGYNWGYGLAGLPVVATGLLLLMIPRAMPRRTAPGREALRRTLGFARYIETAETHQQDFAERAGIFTEYLPYAVAFETVSRWASAFRDIDVQAATRGWYAGRSQFAPDDFSSGLSSFQSAVSSTLTSTPGGSGGSGFGGGSSGGGGGGGGGGSW